MTTSIKPAEAIEDRPTATTTDVFVQRARDTADAAIGAAEQVTARIPGAAGEVDRIIRSGSDDTLRLVTAAAIGLTVGLFAAGANRILVLAALLPAAMVAMILAGRRSL